MLSAGQKIAHFELIGKLGAGGMGVVYKARDVQLDRLIALKVLPPARADDAAMRSRLLREARPASALNHSHIARPAKFVAATSLGLALLAGAGGGASSSVAPTGYTTRRSRKCTGWPTTKNSSSLGNSVCAHSRSSQVTRRWTRPSPDPLSHLS